MILHSFIATLPEDPTNARLHVRSALGAVPHRGGSAEHCWEASSSNLEQGPGNDKDRCANRHAHLTTAQHECLARHWCGGVVKDGGVLCSEGVSRFEMRRGSSTSGKANTLVLQRGQLPRSACRAPEDLLMDRRGRVERWNVSLPTDRFWDPPPLPPQWWMPARAELKVAAPASRSNSNEHAKLEDYEEADCSSTPRLLVEMTDVGQTNNILVVFTHALQLVATHRGTSLASLVLSHGFEKQIAPYFDWRTAFRGWACKSCNRRLCAPYSGR